MTSMALALGRFAAAAGLVLLALLLGFWLSARPATAGSELSGDVRGLEFCTQSLCGSAFFLGLFDEWVDERVNEAPGTDGAWQLSVRHEQLPDPRQSAAITGGDWRLRLGWRTHFRGEVGRGLLYNSGDESFAVKAELIREDEAAMWFFGLLDHSVFPPSVKGCILPAEPPDPPTTDPCGRS